MAQKPDHYVFYEFDALRLTDRDNDGWLEYVDTNGNRFLSEGRKINLQNKGGRILFTWDAS